MFFFFWRLGKHLFNFISDLLCFSILLYISCYPFIFSVYLIFNFLYLIFYYSYFLIHRFPGPSVCLCSFERSFSFFGVRFAALVRYFSFHSIILLRYYSRFQLSSSAYSSCLAEIFFLKVLF